MLLAFPAVWVLSNIHRQLLRYENERPELIFKYKKETYF
jgi:hypothetical protein